MLRLFLIASLLAGSSLANGQEKPSRENAIAVINRAIKAMGSEEKLKLRKGYRLLEKGMLRKPYSGQLGSVVRGFGNDYYREDCVFFGQQSPDSYRMLSYIWNARPDGVQYGSKQAMAMMGDPHIKTMRCTTAMYSLGFDPSSLKDKELYSFTLQQEEKLEEEPVIRIDVEGVSEPLLQLSCFFSKRTGLLKKTSFLEVLPHDPKGSEHAMLYLVYQDVEGVKTPYLVEHRPSHWECIGTITGLQFTTELNEADFVVEVEGQ